MKESEDYELYDSDFGEWHRKGAEAFGIEIDHPGNKEEKR